MGLLAGTSDGAPLPALRRRVLRPVPVPRVQGGLRGRATAPGSAAGYAAGYADGYAEGYGDGQADAAE